MAKNWCNQYMQCQLVQVRKVLQVFSFSKFLQGPHWRLWWAESGPQAVCFTPILEQYFTLHQFEHHFIGIAGMKIGIQGCPLLLLSLSLTKTCSILASNFTITSIARSLDPHSIAGLVISKGMTVWHLSHLITKKGGDRTEFNTFVLVCACHSFSFSCRNWKFGCKFSYWNWLLTKSKAYLLSF